MRWLLRGGRVGVQVRFGFRSSHPPRPASLSLLLMRRFATRQPRLVCVPTEEVSVSKQTSLLCHRAYNMCTEYILLYTCCYHHRACSWGLCTCMCFAELCGNIPEGDSDVSRKQPPFCVCAYIHTWWCIMGHAALGGIWTVERSLLPSCYVLLPS